MAIELAKKCYEEWMPTISFEDDLQDYLYNGVVISRPDLFVMAKVCDLSNEELNRLRKGELPADDSISGAEAGWFIRMLVGDLRIALASMPYYFPKIAFSRHQQSRIRVYKLDRLLQLTQVLHGKN